MEKEKNDFNANNLTDEELKQAATDQSKEDQDGLLGKDLEKTDDDEKAPTSGEKEEGNLSLEERFANLEKANTELEKVNKGLYGSMKAEREERQDLSSRLEGITQIFSESLAKRDEKADAPEPEKLSIDRLKVEVDDDGNAFIPVDDTLKSLIAAQNSGSTNKEVEELRRTVEQDKIFRDEEADFQVKKNAIIGEDPAYVPAYDQISKAYDWFNNRLVEYQKDNRIPGFVSTPEALDIADQENFEQEFKKEFPTVDMEKAARLYDGTHDFRTGLKSGVLSSEKKSGAKSAEDNLRDIAGKASTLAGVRNQRISQGSLTLDEVAERSGEIKDMTDEEVAKLHRLMKREEEAA